MTTLSIHKFPLLGFAFIFLVVSCTTTTQIPKKNIEEPVIATIAGIPLYLSDFKYNYEKNTSKDQRYTRQSVQDQLESYINFRLKIIEAEKLGIDKSEDFQKELSSYQEQLSIPYLTDKQKVDELVQEAYQRLKEEVNVSHILLRIPEEADPSDTLVAYEKILEIRQKALEGKDFENLAYTYSQDEGSKSNAGNLGYFTALQMVYNFENASYKTEVGSISNLLRTRLGYHFLKVVDRRPTSGKMKTAHIMVHLPKNSSKLDSVNAEKKINQIYELLKQGEDWNKLCMQFSDDISSKDKGGELPEFTVGLVIPEFEKATFELKSKDDISKPILTGYGWHIIKLLEKTDLEPFTEIEDQLRQKVIQDSRYETTQKILIQKLQKANNFVEFLKNKEKAFSKISEDLLKGKWEYNTEDPILKETLVSFENKTIKRKTTYSVKHFFDYVIEKEVPREDIKQKAYYLDLLYQRYIDYLTLDFERNSLEQKYPAYKTLVKEYKEGMLLFQITNQNVWTKGVIDTIGCKDFFEKNRQNYRWNYRAKATIYDIVNEEVFEKLKIELAKGKYAVENSLVKPVYFEKDRDILDKKITEYLDKVILVLENDPSLQIEIAGNADPAENNKLASGRANQIANYLSAKGINLSRMIIKDFGVYKPVSKTERDKNRRVELTLYSSSKRVLANQLNKDNSLNIRIFEGIYEKGKNTYLDKIEWNLGNQLYKDNDRLVYIDIQEIQEPRLKEFKETQGAAINDYQVYLEEEWLSKLKTKYPVKVNQEEVDKLITKTK